MIFVARSFIKILHSNLKGIASWRILLPPAGICIVTLIAHPSIDGLGMAWYFLSSPIAWLLCIVVMIADAFIAATVWYYRERNPRYIAKMNRIEQEKQEKAGALNAQKNNPPEDE